MKDDQVAVRRSASRLLHLSIFLSHAHVSVCLQMGFQKMTWQLPRHADPKPWLPGSFPHLPTSYAFALLLGALLMALVEALIAGHLG